MAPLNEQLSAHRPFDLLELELEEAVSGIVKEVVEDLDRGGN